MLTVSGLSGPGLGLWVHGMPDTALQNDRVCASRRTKPDGMDLRQNGGSRSKFGSRSATAAAIGFGYRNWTVPGTDRPPT